MDSQVGVSLPLPEGGLVYDYRIEDGGLFCSTGPGKKGEEEEEDEKAKGKTKVLFSYDCPPLPLIFSRLDSGYSCLWVLCCCPN